MQYDVTWSTWQLSHVNLYVTRSDIFVNTLLSVLSNLYFKDFLWFLLNHSIPVLHPDSPVWLRLSDRIILVALWGGRQGIFRLNSAKITKMITEFTDFNEMALYMIFREFNLVIIVVIFPQKWQFRLKLNVFKFLGIQPNYEPVSEFMIFSRGHRKKCRG